MPVPITFKHDHQWYTGMSSERTNIVGNGSQIEMHPGWTCRITDPHTTPGRFLAHEVMFWRTVGS
jgi:hypothetical protein